MFILETLNFVVDILKVPSVLVGLIALIGLVAQKKAFSDVVKGTIKTILGFIGTGRRCHRAGRVIKSFRRYVRTRLYDSGHYSKQ